MPYRLALVGLGPIARSYCLGLKDTKVFELVAVCDKNPDCLSRPLYRDYPFFTSPAEMIAKIKPDFVLVSTPPATHYAIGREVLEAGCNLLVEKPATTDFSDLQDLIKLAREKKVLLDVVFHWNYGSEVLYLKDKLKDYPQIAKIKTIIFDPYSEHNKIKVERVNMGGTWLDSGVNAMSMLSSLLDFKEIGLLERKYLLDKECNLPYYSLHRFDLGGIETEIEINWDTPLNRKMTYVWFKNGETMVIAHSEQRIYHDGKVVFEDARFERLSTHYRNYFIGLDVNNIDLEKTEQIHSTLFAFY